LTAEAPGAIAMDQRFGFTVSDAWDAREQLVCMQRAV
jgi:putative acetyltransferase